jgi:hypothetical protein
MLAVVLVVVALAVASPPMPVLASRASYAALDPATDAATTRQASGDRDPSRIAMSCARL